MSDFADLDSDNSDFDELEKKEQEAAEAIKIDSDLYQFLTEEMVEGYLPLIVDIGQLEGDYIDTFNTKANDKGITAKDDYINQLCVPVTLAELYRSLFECHFSVVYPRHDMTVL